MRSEDTVGLIELKLAQALSYPGARASLILETPRMSSNSPLSFKLEKDGSTKRSVYFVAYSGRRMKPGLLSPSPLNFFILFFKISEI